MTTARAAASLLYVEKHLLSGMPRGGVFGGGRRGFVGNLRSPPFPPLCMNLVFWGDGLWGIRTNICKLKVNIALTKWKITDMYLAIFLLV
jgi:hypothetical protein